MSFIIPDNSKPFIPDLYDEIPGVGHYDLDTKERGESAVFTCAMERLGTWSKDPLKFRESEPQIGELIQTSNLSQKEIHAIAMQVISCDARPNVGIGTILGMTKQADLLQVALAAAQHRPNSLYYDIAKCGLRKEKDRVKVILELFRYHESETAFRIADILETAPIENPEAILHFIALAFQKVQDVFKRHVVKEACKTFPALSHEIVLLVLSSEDFLRNPDDFRDVFPQVQNVATAFLPDLKAEIAAQKAPLVKQQLEQWLYKQQMRLFVLANADSVSPQLVALSKELMEYRDPAEREKLSEAIALRFADPQILDLWLQIVPEKGVHTLIPTALALLCSGHKPFLLHFAQAVRGARDVLRVAAPFHLFVGTLFTIAQKDYTPSQKEALLNQIFRAKEDIVARLRHLRIILMLGHEQALWDRKEPLSLQALAQLHATSIASSFAVDMQDFGGPEAFLTLYETTIEKRWRDPYAPLTYAGKLELLSLDEDRQMMRKAYGEFLKHYLLGTLQQARFSTPHFAVLDPHVVKKWKALDNEVKPLMPYASKETSSHIKEKYNFEKCTIGVTRNAEDLMLVGRETGGCQTIDGDPAVNKCALAYMYDGKNLLVYIRGEDGKLKARAILRLLFHKESGKEVLFLERCYSYYHEVDFSSAIQNYAKEVAASLNLPLLTKDVSYSNQLPFAGTVHSFGSNVPYENADHGGGTCARGVFKIEKVSALFIPTVFNPLQAIHDPNATALARHFNLK